MADSLTRQNIIQPTTVPLLHPQRKLYPEKKDRDAWWAYFSGAPEHVWNPPRTVKQPKARKQRDDPSCRQGEVQDSPDPTLAEAGWQVVPPSQSVLTPERRNRSEIDSLPDVPSVVETTEGEWVPREPKPMVMRFIDHVGPLRMHSSFL